MRGLFDSLHNMCYRNYDNVVIDGIGFTATLMTSAEAGYRVVPALFPRCPRAVSALPRALFPRIPLNRDPSEPILNGWSPEANHQC
jgi:hypothetical protein